MNEVDPGILQADIAEERSEVLVFVGVEEVRISKDDDGVARGVLGDVLLQLLKVGRAGFFVPFRGANLRYSVSY